MRRLAALITALALVGCVPAAAAPRADSARIAALEQQVAELDGRLDVLEEQLAATPTPTALPTPGPTSTSAPAPTPTPPSSGPSFTDLPGWDLRFADEFNDRSVPRGHFLDGATEHSLGWFTADGRYNAFKAHWPDTSRHGFYGSASIIEISNGILDEHVRTIDGWPRTATFTVLPAGSSSKGGLLGARSFVRLRADPIVGFKGVPLWWADAAVDNDLLMQYGEIDGPEGPLDRTPAVFMHRTGATRLDDQYWAPYPAGTRWQDWHDYVTEWIPGKSVKYFVDGELFAQTTDRIPTTAMHFNLQFETNTGSGPWPDASAEGHIQIDRLAVWAYAP